MRLSLLDPSVTVSGRSQAEAIRDTVALAVAAEALGYHRVWISEHHGYAGLAGSAPMPLLGAIAAKTRRIRIGAAAVILPHVAPLKAAEEALVLEALAPGRVDLGLGRGPAANRATAYALSPETLDNPMLPAGAGFAEDVATILAFLEGTPLPDDHLLAGVRAVPKPESLGPAPFIVGGTAQTARLAARLGLPYAFAHFAADGAGMNGTLDLYRSAFQPSRFLSEPAVVVAAFAAAAETDTGAAALQSAYRRWRRARDTGAFLPIDVPLAGDETPAAPARAHGFGTADRVVADLVALKAEARADEIVLMLPIADRQARLTAMRLIADAAGLVPEAAGIAPPLLDGAARHGHPLAEFHS